MELKDIKIIAIDKEGIEKDNSFENAFKYPFLLSSRPDDLWVKYFHSVYRLHAFDKKRQYTIVEKKVLVILSGEDDKQKQVDFFKDVIRETNKQYCDLIKTKEEERKKEEAKKQREQEKIQHMRSEVDHIDFS